MQDNNPDQEHIEDSENDANLGVSNLQGLDPQTLENLAAFLSRESEDTNKQEKMNEDDKNELEEPITPNESSANNAQDNESASASRSRSRSKSSGSPSLSHPANRSRSNSRSRSRSREKSSQRQVHCCVKCKKNDKRGKACVCVVPAGQRRIAISKEGCSTCGCNGCSKEDVQLRQEKKVEEIVDKDELERMRNGCCRECMKAFSTINKACICQVPSSVRRRKIPDSGCVICGCFGCNPEDTQQLVIEKRDKSPKRETAPLKIEKFGRKMGHRHHRDGSSDRSQSPRRSDPGSSNSAENNPTFNNLDNSFVGNFLKNTFNINPHLIGFGIPQRTYSYIYGKPPPK